MAQGFPLKVFFWAVFLHSVSDPLLILMMPKSTGLVSVWPFNSQQDNQRNPATNDSKVADCGHPMQFPKLDPKGIILWCGFK